MLGDQPTHPPTHPPVEPCSPCQCMLSLRTLCCGTVCVHACIFDVSISRWLLMSVIHNLEQGNKREAAGSISFGQQQQQQPSQGRFRVGRRDSPDPRDDGADAAVSQPNFAQGQSLRGFDGLNHHSMSSTPLAEAIESFCLGDSPGQFCGTKNPAPKNSKR